MYAQRYPLKENLFVNDSFWNAKALIRVLSMDWLVKLE